MKPTDIMPHDDWLKSQEKTTKMLDAGTIVFDADGKQATDFTWPRNSLCQSIRENPDGLTQICARAHQNMSTMANRNRSAVIDECDAGMVKVVTPILADDEFVGTSTACGFLWHDEEVDSFYIGKVTGFPEERVLEMAESVRRISRDEASHMAAIMKETLGGTPGSRSG